MAFDDGGRKYPDGYGPPDDAPAQPGDYQGDPAGYGSDYADPFSPARETEPPTVDQSYEPNAALGERLNDLYDEVGGRDSNDRLFVHVVLEVVLLVAAGGAMFWAYQGDGSLFKGESLQSLLLAFGATLMLATASALTLRVRAVNLGLFAFAWAGMALFIKLHKGFGTLVAAGIAVGVAIAAGLVLALLIMLLKMPGWAASLAVGFGMYAVTTLVKVPAAVPDFGIDLSKRAILVVAAALAISLVGGIVGALPGTRRVLGACRDHAPGGRRTRGAITLTLFGTVGAATLAGVAGVLLALSMPAGASTGGGARLEVLGYAGMGLAAALLGGTSALGRRGGFAGTIVASALLFGVYTLTVAHEWNTDLSVIIGGGLIAGIVVSWLVETLGKPDSIPAEYRTDETKDLYVPSYK